AGGTGAPPRVWTAAALAAFYLLTPESCHCQRDGWTLLPATVALCLRDGQLRAIASASPSARVFLQAVPEGLCWGAAGWVKPFVAGPALACWAVGALPLRRDLWLTLPDAGCLLAGGLLAGGLGLAYLAASGAWPSFWDILLGWNRDYAAFASGGEPHLAWLL